ncbi:MAG: glycoside hydrolase family 99-like domain-containing protein [Planctomycetaceae bacterium]|jgi:hypothetical protein|nr:glycoside hydrolase family 99-like domain-containing protein [Planctomycetaceae bacterium]
MKHLLYVLTFVIANCLFACADEFRWQNGTLYSENNIADKLSGETTDGITVASETITPLGDNTFKVVRTYKAKKDVDSARICFDYVHSGKDKPATIGVYYFDGWAGKHKLADDPNEPWAKNAPISLSRRMVEEFPEREPLWGWRDDTQEIMERQIDLAADNGVDFFLFCWYWHDNKGTINIEAIENAPLHTSMELYLTAKNKKRLKYSLLIANHRDFEILGNENWESAVKYWSKFFKDPQYIKVDGKPLVVLFGTGDNAITNEQIAKMQETAKKEGFKDGLAIAGCYESAKQKAFTFSTHYNLNSGYSSGHEEHKFQELIDRVKPRWKGTEEQPYIPVINSGWDKRPWENPNGPSQGWYFPDSSPELFKSFLKDAIHWMDENPTKTTKERLVLIYAWNELGEGGYLVPTKVDPDAAKLKMIKEVVNEK